MAENFLMYSCIGIYTLQFTYLHVRITEVKIYIREEF